MVNIIRNIVNTYEEGSRYEVYSFSTETKTIHILDKQENRYYKITIEELIKKGRS